MLQGALDCKGKDPTISQTTAQQSDDFYEQTFGDGGKEELAFNRKKPVRASFRELQPSAITGWGEEWRKGI